MTATIQPGPTQPVVSKIDLAIVAPVAPCLQHEPMRELRQKFQELAAAAPLVKTTAHERIHTLATRALRAAPKSIDQAQALQTLEVVVGESHQAVRAEAVLASAVEAVREIGFPLVEVRPETGYLLARQGPEGPFLRVDVVPSWKETQLVFDAAGFQGRECERALENLEHRLRQRGVELEVVARRCKRRHQFARNRVAITGQR